MSEFKERKLVTGNGLLVGIPTLGRPVPLDWAFAFKSMNPPMNYNSNHIIIHGKPVDEARNEIAEHAIRLGSKYLFFLGDDVVCPPNTLRQLIYRMEQDPKLGVVGAVYCSKSDPPAPLIFREYGMGSYWDFKIGEFIDCAGLGMDATLIRTEIFSKIAKPWFKTVDEDQFADGINNADQWTEDLYFCKKVYEETQYKIMVDTSLICKHWDVYGNKSYTLPATSLSARRLKVAKSKRAVDIGCGPVDRSDQFSDFDLVRVDIREEVNPDYRCDVRNLPFANREFDLVFSSHVLEHFGRTEWEGVLNEWIRLLKPDGELILVLPNLQWAVDYMKGECEQKTATENDALNVFYGAQSNPFDYHYNGFWPERLKKHLEGLGFSKISMDFQGYNMITNARR